MFSLWVCVIWSTVMWKLFPWTAGVFCTHDSFVILYFLWLQTGVDPAKLLTARQSQLKYAHRDTGEKKKLNHGSPSKKNAVVLLVCIFSMHWSVALSFQVFSIFFFLLSTYMHSSSKLIKYSTYMFKVSYDVTSCLHHESVFPGNDAACFSYEWYKLSVMRKALAASRSWVFILY